MHKFYRNCFLSERLERNKYQRKGKYLCLSKGHIYGTTYGLINFKPKKLIKLTCF